MPLFEMTSDSFRPIEEASFTEMQIRERGDLQRMLRTQIDVLGDDLYVLTEEFGDWEDSKRRIDLLAIDSDANLVVIELKRTHDGGHMELQAIRYASMVSAMTFDRAVQIHATFLSRIGEPHDEARDRILEFLVWEDVDEDLFAADVRILLVSEDFGKELTTAVLWLRDREIDVRCIRLRPYRDAGRTMIDVQQIIPLPEAHDYQVQLREKEQQGRRQKAERFDIRLRFWQGVVNESRATGGKHAHIKPSSYSWIGAGSGTRGLGFNFAVLQNSSQAELYIDRGNATENKNIFDTLHTKKEQVEAIFGEPLVWERLDTKRACRIKHELKTGGYRTSETDWPAVHRDLVKAMSQLVAALGPAIESLNL